MKEPVHETHPVVINRLKRAEGHLRKVIKMLENGDSCPLIAQQLHGVYSAIGKAKNILIQDHIEHCLDETLLSSSVKTQSSTLKEFREITKYL